MSVRTGDGWLDAGVNGIGYSSALSSLVGDGEDCGAVTWMVNGPVFVHRVEFMSEMCHQFWCQGQRQRQEWLLSSD